MLGQVVMVAVDASKEITGYALEWTVKNVTQSADTLVVLAVLPSCGGPPAPANRANSFFSCLLNVWSSRDREKAKDSSDEKALTNAVPPELSRKLNKVLVQMIRQLCLTHDKQVHSEVKVVTDAELGSVATEAEELEATWVVVDHRLRREADCCAENLDCNVVIVDHAIPKVVKAVDPLAKKKLTVIVEQTDPESPEMYGLLPSATCSYGSATTRTTFGLESPVSSIYLSESSSSSEKDRFKLISLFTNKSNSPSSVLHLNSANFKQEIDQEAPSPSYSKNEPSNDTLPRKSSTSPVGGKIMKTSNLSLAKIDLERINSSRDSQPAVVIGRPSTYSPGLPRTRSKSAHRFGSRKNSWSGHEEEKLLSPSSPGVDRTSSIRKAMSLSMKQPPTPPPLCSVCKHSTPVFGKSPMKFGYKELEAATEGFSSELLLAEGGFGSVYKGILPDGQVVAVKQRKTLSAQGASEFCAEVEVLSCAQHKNLVMLVGYCIEKEWLLVYEFSCNGSLDEHLYGDEVMAWNNRMKVAIGAARGLRYLHEDCRVGCIVHRDFRPKNIHLTHDFEPMVGDFGLARWQVDGQSAEETRVVGAFGYLAPEYTQTGLITEKADVYAFGVVLLELLSGIRATEFSRNSKQQFVREWGRPLLETKMVTEILDPRLEGSYAKKEVECMMYAASLCTSPDPEKRPRMSKVLKILEGDVPSDLACSIGQYISNYPQQYINRVYDLSDGSMTATLGDRPNLLKPSPDKCSAPKMQLKKESPSRPSVHMLHNDFEAAEGARNTNLSDMDVSVDYQAYLQSSLANFMQKLNRT